MAFLYFSLSKTADNKLCTSMYTTYIYFTCEYFFFSELEQILNTSTQIMSLSLSHNEYTSIPSAISLIPRGQLEYLNLSHNSIRDLQPMDMNTFTTSMKKLDLSHNKFKGFAPEVTTILDRMHKIEEIRLQGNPWSCDLCHIIPLNRWLQNVPLFSNECSRDPYGTKFENIL